MIPALTDCLVVELTTQLPGPDRPAAWHSRDPAVAWWWS